MKKSRLISFIGLGVSFFAAVICFLFAINEATVTAIISASTTVTKGPNPIFNYVLYLGDWSLLVLLAALPILNSDRDFRLKKAFPLAITTIVGIFSGELMRLVIDKIFPAVRGVRNIYGVSFPCPAVMNITVFSAALFVLVMRYIKKPAYKRITLTLLCLLPVIVGISALGAALYDLTDVIAGVCLGVMSGLIMNLVTTKKDEVK